MSYRFQHGLVLTLSLASLTQQNISAQQKAAPPAHTQSQSKEEEPPEEDDTAKPKEYAFNPLQAAKEIEVGDFYLKKGSYGSAIKRYTEATRWNPTLAEAYLKLGDAEAKFKDQKAAKEAYSKYLELAPDAKNAAAVKKKLSRM
jgi:tetratricopeptide (TPR) repeat protein